MACEYKINGLTLSKDEFLNYVKKQPLEDSSKILGIMVTPSAPFITDTNKYVQLGLKVALKYAVNSGATKITWESGETQNDRYDLSKQVDEISTKKYPDGTYTIIGNKNGNSVFEQNDVPENRLEEFVGKDLAKKISDKHNEEVSFRKGAIKEFQDFQNELQDSYGKVEVRILESYLRHPNNENSAESKKYFTLMLEAKKEYEGINKDDIWNSFRGVDLKVGGKGMKGFYGSPIENKLGIVGNVAKSLFKQEPKTVSIPRYNEWVVTDNREIVKSFQTENEAKKYAKDNGLIAEKNIQGLEITQHSIDITPEMVAEVGKGLPLFKANKIENRYERQTPEGLPYVSDTAFSYGASDSNILPDRSEGKEEFTTVRGMWRETKDIQFNGKVKIESPDDVAEIFALLENKSIEHSFAIYIDEKGYPTIQFLSVGARSQTVIDPIQVIAGVNKYKPKKVYLIHNHPSGSLKPSNADLNVTNAVRSSIGGVELEHIIINTYKKQYVLIDKDNYTSVRDRKGKEGDYYEIPIVSYNDVEFLEEPAAQIKSSKSVIDFIQGQRFSALPKKGMLLLNRQNEVIANYLIKENDEKEGDSILDVIAKTPTTDGIILYGNTLNVPRSQAIKSILERVGIGLIDSLVLNSDGLGVTDYYKSMMDEGLIKEHHQKYGTNSISKPEIISQDDINNLPDCI